VNNDYLYEKTRIIDAADSANLKPEQQFGEISLCSVFSICDTKCVHVVKMKGRGSGGV